MGSFRIRTADSKIIISGTATKADDTPYDLTVETTSVEFLLEKPRNMGTLDAKTATITTPNGADFHYITTTNLFNIEGYWGIQARYTLVTGEIVHSQIEYEYIGKTILGVAS